MPQPLLALGGRENAPTLHLSPANGFVPHTYLPSMRPLFEQYHVVSAPPRALWGDGAQPNFEEMMDWRQVADDLLDAFEQFSLKNVVAVGHSLGGIASFLATLKNPQPFKALILLDPTILDPHIFEMMAHLRQLGTPAQHPLAQGALRRKRTFESAEAFYLRYRTHPAFSQWHEDALREYATHGTIPTAEGVTLAWSPEWEAYYFSSPFLGLWEVLPQANPAIPTLIIQGAESDTLTTENLDRVKTLIPHASYVSVAGHGHLFPHTAPHETAQLIRTWLAENGL